MFHLARASVAANRDDIETHRWLIRESIQMIAVGEDLRRTANPILLAIVDRDFRRTESIAHARFDFDEHDRIAILHDDIDLGARSFKVPRDDSISAPLQMPGRKMLAAFAVSQPPSGPGNGIANPEPEVEHGASKA